MMDDKYGKRSVTHVDRLVGNSIKNRRIARGLSQQELASKIGVSFQQIQKYENGGNRITSSRLVQIASALHCGASDFFADIDLDSPAQIVEDVAVDQGHSYASDREVLEMTRLFKGVKNRRLRHVILNMLRAIADSEEE